MSGATVTKLKSTKGVRLETITITPELAAKWLERNASNRKLRRAHVKRLERLIRGGRWWLNGATIKFSDDGDLLDGQHRLQAIIAAGMPVQSVVVSGLDRAVFSTLDAAQAVRTSTDVLDMAGVEHNARAIGAALTWLLRWQSGCIEQYKQAEFRVENDDVAAAMQAHPGMARAVARIGALRGLGQTAPLAFLYYVLADRAPELAERMVESLRNPAGIALDDPFFRLRAHLIADHQKRREVLVTVALAIKAINAAARGEPIKLLAWRTQGPGAEPFPALEV